MDAIKRECSSIAREFYDTAPATTLCFAAASYLFGAQITVLNFLAYGVGGLLIAHTVDHVAKSCFQDTSFFIAFGTWIGVGALVGGLQGACVATATTALMIISHIAFACCHHKKQAHAQRYI